MTKLNPVRPDVSTAVKVHIGALCFNTPPSLVDGTGVSQTHIASNVALSLLHAVRSYLLRTSVLKPAFSPQMHSCLTS